VEISTKDIIEALVSKNQDIGAIKLLEDFSIEDSKHYLATEVEKEKDQDTLKALKTTEKEEERESLNGIDGEG